MVKNRAEDILFKIELHNNTVFTHYIYKSIIIYKQTTAVFNKTISSALISIYILQYCLLDNNMPLNNIILS